MMREGVELFGPRELSVRAFSQIGKRPAEVPITRIHAVTLDQYWQVYRCADKRVPNPTTNSRKPPQKQTPITLLRNSALKSGIFTSWVA
jgi:hypothetical protein